MSQSGPTLIDTSIPVELIAEIIQRIPFDAKVTPTLSLVHSRFRDLLHNYQTSIAKNYATRNLPHVFQDFPCGKNAIKYEWLANCIRQYDVVDDVMAVLLSEVNCFAIEKHNMAVLNTGLLLLYRLCSVGKTTKSGYRLRVLTMCRQFGRQDRIPQVSSPGPTHSHIPRCRQRNSHRTVSRERHYQPKHVRTFLGCQSTRAAKRYGILLFRRHHEPWPSVYF
jgi:hypothetical protein